MNGFVVGQRWRSEMEPELGVGIVDGVEGRRVRLRFPQSNLARLYAAGSAPLQRVVFQPGDRVSDETGVSLTIRAVEDDNGLMVYCGDGRRLREDRLSGILVLDTPKDRLMAGQREPSAGFDLRWRVLDARCRMARSPAHGFVGGRVDLIPHQFAIAAEVCGRRHPRVLLADEAGLGKTIEAGLILHRLSTIGRVDRVLAIVPDALVVQWFVELARRFNLQFRILDQETLREGRLPASSENPFEDEPLSLCGFSFLSAVAPDGRAALIRAGWDMVVVDEAHHLQPGDGLFEAVRRLSESVPRLIMITATPGPMAARSHFTRLHLLDPVRYPDVGRFKQEHARHADLARMLQRLADDATIAGDDLAALSRLLHQPEGTLRETLRRTDDRRQLIHRIIDRHGTGRVMFRTCRRSVAGFPGRNVHVVPLDVADGASPARVRLNREFLGDSGRRPADGGISLDDDPRVDWLEQLLRTHRDEKILLICRTAGKVNALFDALDHRINARIGRYHEAMTLVQRDRNAAWFTAPDGATLLLCSEIGSEGRNFQCARRLVLFDLPVDADLLEQRIGRLDRIGQTGVVQVMVPYVRGTGGEVLARWYHEALGAFDANVPAAGWVTRRLIEPLIALVEKGDAPMGRQRLERLIRCGRLSVARQQRRIEAGRDRLLELDARPPDQVRQLMADIRGATADIGFTHLLDRLLDVWGIAMEPIAPAIFRLTPDHRYADPLPGFRPAGMTVTTDRAIALAREDLGFLTWDHPLVAGAMELYLGSGKGDAAFAVSSAPGRPELFLEMIFVIEAAAQTDVVVQTLLPPTPVRVVVDRHLKANLAVDVEKWATPLTDGPAVRFARLLPAVSELVPEMVDAGRRLATLHCRSIIETAAAAAGRWMDDDVGRLRALARVSPAAGQGATADARREWEGILAAIGGAGVRLDALRLVATGTWD